MPPVGLPPTGGLSEPVKKPASSHGVTSTPGFCWSPDGRSSPPRSGSPRTMLRFGDGRRPAAPGGRPDRERAGRDRGASLGLRKWWYRRGNLVDHFLKSPQASEIFLGDNGGRLRFGPRPRLFRVAEPRGIRVLPGSDPFPLDTDVKRDGKLRLCHRRNDRKVSAGRKPQATAPGRRHTSIALRQSHRDDGILQRNQLLIRLNAQRIRVRRAASGR